MGKKTNPNGIRLFGLVEKAFLSATYYNNWFSDIQYSSLFYKDLLLRKHQINFFMKYYKTKLRFFKGRQKSRRLKSFLRFSTKSYNISRLPYKIKLLGFFLRTNNNGLQKKNSAFMLKTNLISKK